MEKGPKLTQCQVPGQRLDAAGNLVPVAPCYLGKKDPPPEGLVVCTAERRAHCGALAQLKVIWEQTISTYMPKKTTKVVFGQVAPTRQDILNFFNPL